MKGGIKISESGFSVSCFVLFVSKSALHEIVSVMGFQLRYIHSFDNKIKSS